MNRSAPQEQPIFVSLPLTQGEYAGFVDADGGPNDFGEYAATPEDSGSSLIERLGTAAVQADRLLVVTTAAQADGPKAQDHVRLSRTSFAEQIARHASSVDPAITAEAVSQKLNYIDATELLAYGAAEAADERGASG